MLDYPDAEFKSELTEMRQVIQQASVSSSEKKTITVALDWMQSLDLITLQQEYVETFDLTADHSLHLTHHLFGDDRGRGPALVDLAEFYKKQGFNPETKELPDYLPLILEFVAQQDDQNGRKFLADALKVIKQLTLNLEAIQSPYAPLIKIIEHYGQPLTHAA